MGGSLPTGLTLSSSGFISGTPSTTSVSTFTIQVKDNVGSTARESFRLQVIPSSAATSTSAHAYYNQLLLRPDLYRNWSMRANTSTDTHGLLPSTMWSYTWPNDGYFDAQDAVKLVKNPNPSTRSSDSIPTGEQVRFPVQVSTGIVVATFDWYHGIEFKLNSGTVQTHKFVQMASDGPSTGHAGDVYCELRTDFGFADGSTDVAGISPRGYVMSTVTGNAQFVPGLKSQQPYSPTGQGVPAALYRVKPNCWTRYWIEMKLKQDGANFTEWNAISTQALQAGSTYNMISIWMADEVTDPRRIIYRAPWRIRGTYFQNIWWELNTSWGPGQTGPLIGYGRNVVIMRDTAADEGDTGFFKRPTR